MGEAQQHISYAADRMVDSWDMLLPPVEIPPPPLQKTFRATKAATDKPASKVVGIIPSIPSVPNADERLCHWCGKPFQPNRRNQIFCTPDKERKPNWERRKALVVALAEHFKARGRKWVDMLALAQRCVNACYEGVYRAMKALGYVYGLKTKQWRNAWTP